jgi:predicted RNA-binding Zn ribbon-like protein
MVSGALCLDLLNTTGARASGSPRERLRSYGDLLVWSLRAGVLSPGDVERLRAAAFAGGRESELVVGRARELRERLYRLFRAIADGTEPPAESLAWLSGEWRQERSQRELATEGGRFVLKLQSDGDQLDAMLWPVISSAVDLLVSDRLVRLKRCGECDWLFLDESRNGLRNWCKKDCGDRARARRHYARHRPSRA